LILRGQFHLPLLFGDNHPQLEPSREAWEEDWEKEWEEEWEEDQGMGEEWAGVGAEDACDKMRKSCRME